MKKLLTLFTALIWLGSMSFVQAEDYYVAHNAVMNEKSWNAAGDKMSQIGSTGIYSITFNNVGTTQVQFKVTDGTWSNSWGSFDNALSEITLSTVGGNAAFTLSSSSNVTIYFIDSSKKIYVYTAGAISYTIAGEEELMGSGWNTSAGAGNDMTRQSDGITYTLRRENVELTAGDKSYKVVKNHNWGSGEYPTSGNNTLHIASAGDYDVTFTYIPAKASLTAVAEVHKPSPTVFVPVKFFAPRDETNKWEHVYAFAWCDSLALPAWPGVEVTTKEAEWFVYNAPKGASILFHDNNGMQTLDINKVQEAVCYIPTAIDYESSPKKVTVAADGDCKVEYYIAGSAALVGGTDDFDTNVALGEGNQITLDNVAAGQYKFKINNGTWAWALGGNDHLKSGDCSSIAETVGIGDVGFAIDHTQNITITYYPETQEICLGAETVLDPTLAWNTTFAAARKGMANTLPWLNHTLLAGVVYTSSNPSVASFADENAYELTLNAAGTTTITATYYGYSASYKLDVYDFAVPAKAVETVGGRFIINANNDSVIFSRGNLQYDFGAEQWYFAANQYDVLAEANLHFGDPNYKGVMDLFSWSNGNSNYGRIFSYLDADFTGNDFVDWGGLFTGGDYEWSTLSKDEWSYLMAHNNWTMIQLTPTPVATLENGFLCLVLFPVEWEAPAELASLNYKFYDFDNDAKVAQNTFTMAQWKTLFEANGAVLLPPAGARAGLYGSKISDGVHESTGPGLNPDAGGWYDHVDNVGWYGYYWLTDPHPTKNIQAYYVIFPGWSEGPTDADEDDIFIQPQVWNREKRRGNSVRLVERHPYIDPYVTVREGLTTDAYYTMCLEKAVTDVRGGSIWKIISKAENGTDVLLEDVALPLDAGRPYIFYATADKLEVVYTGSAVGAPLTEGNNGLIGSFVKAPIAQNPNNYIIYNNELYYVNSNNVFVGDHRAYLDMSAVPAYNGGSAPAPGRRRISMAVHGEQVATGIENDGLMNDGMMKVLIDGQLFLIRGEKMYDATGRLVK